MSILARSSVFKAREKFRRAFISRTPKNVTAMTVMSMQMRYQRHVPLVAGGVFYIEFRERVFLI